MLYWEVGKKGNSDMKEEWRPVEGWDGYYEVSNLSQIRSIPRKVVRKNGAELPVRGKVLKPTLGATKKLSVGFNRGHGEKRYYVHRLVAIAFIPNPDNLPLVRHLNDDPVDNRLENLAWGTYSDNMADSLRNGVHSNQNKGKTHCIYGHEFSEENTAHVGKGRVCRTCRNRRKKEYRDRLAAKSLRGSQ